MALFVKVPDPAGGNNGKFETRVLRACRNYLIPVPS